MSQSEKVQRRKEQRRLNRSKVRQVLLVAEYIQYKYFDVYAEAAEFYNTLNNQYPNKYDLRRTEEYKEWKIQVTGQAGKAPRRSKPPLYPNIKSIPNQQSPYTGESQPESPIEIHPQARINVTVTEDSQPASPTLSGEPTSPNMSEEPASPTLSEEPVSPDISEEPASPTLSEEPASPAELQPRKHVYTDNLQLKIPLISHKPKTLTNHCTVSTETLQTVTEEILDESTLQPSLYDELAPELIDKIIEDLRSEPALKDIFTSIEQQLEFQQLGMDIDIDIEDNALDIELDQW